MTTTDSIKKEVKNQMAITDMIRNQVPINMDGKEIMLPACVQEKGISVQDLLKMAGHAPGTRSLCRNNGQYVEQLPTQKVIRVRCAEIYITQIPCTGG